MACATCSTHGSDVATPGDNLLEVEHLYVTFATEAGAAKVLDGVNLTIRAGEIVGLVGESGCGKTTLANAILGILAGNATAEAGAFASPVRISPPCRVGAWPMKSAAGVSRSSHRTP